jgi:hypothetical protein
MASGGGANGEPSPSADPTPPAPGDSTPDAAVPKAGAPEVAPPSTRPYRAIAIAVGEVHACAIMEDHKLKCWGDNFAGQLGLGDARARGAKPSEMGDALPTVDLGTGRTAKAIAARVYSTCALLDDDSVKCWGVPRYPTAQGNVGDWPGEMGDQLAPIALGEGHKATAVALDNLETCVSRDDGNLVCFGSGGQPSLYTRQAHPPVVSLAGAEDVIALFEDGSIWSVPDNPSAVPLHYALPAGAQARKLFGLEGKLCASLTTGGLHCWSGTALNPPETVAPPTTSTDVASVAFTQIEETCWLTIAGGVACDAPVSSFPPPIGDHLVIPLGRPAVAIDGGGERMTCALLDDGSVKCWGEEASAAWMGGSDPDAPGFPAVNLGTRPAP